MTASLLPNGKQQFFDANGDPLGGGQVFMYVPNTTTFKSTWQDPDQTILNSNPITLDSAGEAIIYGSGNYRQVVKDVLGNVIWDALTQDLLGTINTLAQQLQLTFPTEAALQAATIGPTQIFTQTMGGASLGDGQGGTLKRVNGQPTSGGLRSADRYLPDGSVNNLTGGWWQYFGVSDSINVPPIYVTNEYTPTGAEGFTSHQFTSENTLPLTGKERYTMFIGNYDVGTGDGTVPASTYGLGISALKDNWQSTTVQGQMHGLSIVNRGGFHGTNPNPGGSYNPGDSAALVMNSLGSSNQSFVANMEGVSIYANGGAYAYNPSDPVRQIRFQMGGIRALDNPGIGLLLSAEAGPLGAAIQIQNNIALPVGAGTWQKAFSYVPTFATNQTYEAFAINQLGNIVMNNGPAAAIPNMLKTLRVGAGGNLEVVNSAGTAIIAYVTDVGIISCSYAIDMPKQATPPAVAQGRFYFDNLVGKLKISEDGVTWKTVTTS